MSTEHMPENIDQLLLDYHLELLEPADRQQVEQILKTQPQAVTRSERIGRTLQPLSAWTIPAAPKNLVQSVLDRIDGYEEIIRFEPARKERRTGSDGGVFRSVVALREVLAIAASILIIVGVFVPSYYARRGPSRGTNSPQQIEAGVFGRDWGTIFNNHAGYHPYSVGQAGGASWLPVSEQGRSSGTTTRKVRITITGIHPGQVLFPSHFPPERESISQDDTGEPYVQTAVPLVTQQPNEAHAGAPIRPE